MARRTRKQRGRIQLNMDLSLETHNFIMDEASKRGLSPTKFARLLLEDRLRALKVQQT